MKQQVTVFVSNTSGNRLAKAQQDHVRHVLEAKGIHYLEVDIGDPHHVADKVMVKTNVSKTSASLVTDSVTSPPLPPHIFNNGTYRGDYADFFSALECERLYEYLDMEAPEHEVEYMRKHEPPVIVNTAKA